MILINNSEWSDFFCWLGKFILDKSIVVFIGFCSFKFYERYKNKKEYNKLYIEFIKLNAIIESILKTFKEKLNNHSNLNVLEKTFILNDELRVDILETFKKISNLRYFISEDNYYEENLGWVNDYKYDRKQYIYIQQIQDEINSLDIGQFSDETRYYNILGHLKSKLDYLNNLDAINEVKIIKERIKRLKTEEGHLRKAWSFLDELLNEFLGYDDDEKEEHLDKLISNMISEDNDFTIHLKVYNEYVRLKKVINDNKVFKIDSKKFEKVDIDLIGLYDVKFYMQLKEKIKEIDEQIMHDGDVDEIEKLYKSFTKELFQPTQLSIKKLKKILKRVNRFFSNL